MSSALVFARFLLCWATLLGAPTLATAQPPAAPTPPPATAQGLYAATDSTGTMWITLITPSGQVFAVYSNASTHKLGFLTGQGSESNSIFSANVYDFSNPAKFGVSATFSATNYVEDVTLPVTFIENGVTDTFTASGDPVYNQAALQSQVQGTWTDVLGNNVAISWVVSSNGNFTGTANTCSFTGTMTPDASGKDFFDLTVSLSGTCNPSGAHFTGVAIYSPGPPAVLIAIANSGNAAGFFFVFR